MRSATFLCRWQLWNPQLAARCQCLSLLRRRSPAAAAISLRDWADGGDPYKATAELLDPRGRYAISDSAWAMHVLGLQRALPESSYVSMTTALPMLRAIKNPEEIERLTAAGAAADASLEEIVQVRFAGRAETDVGADLADLLRRHGHSQVDFTVVGSGPNGANPHHELGEREIQDGDMVVLDFGGLKDGYGSDTTRTVHVGKPSEEERKVFEIVRRAQQAGFEAVRPGVACEEIDRPRARSSPTPDTASISSIASGTGSASRRTSRPTWLRARLTRSSRECASRSSPGSTCRAASGSGSRTSSSPPRTADGV